MSTPRPSVALIGPGRVGSAMVRALQRAGWRVERIAGRRPAVVRRAARRLGVPAAAAPEEAASGPGLVILAVPRGELRPLAARLARAARPWRGRVVLHTAGDAPDSALGALSRAGASVGRLHPLHAFTGRPRDADALGGGCWFGISGSRGAQSAARRLVRSLGGRAVPLTAGREGAYHLSAVHASNLLVALAAVAAALGPRWGRSRRGALAALLPLIRATLENLEARGLPAALTGPVARGEAGTVRAHLALLRGNPGAAAVYRALSRVAVELAEEDGRLGAAEARALRRVLDGGAARRTSVPRGRDTS